MRISSRSRAHAQHTFAQAPQATIPRASFNRSHGYKTTFNSGFLVPFLVDEILPGDTVSLSATMFGRFSTLIYPLMDNVYIETFYFFVPNRLVWNNWERFNGAQDDPTDSTDFVLPTMTAPAVGGVATGDLADYFGIPIKVNSLQFQSLPFRGYNLIYNEWFRDQNLQNSVVVDLDDGPDNYTDYVLLRRGKRHDYFTSCLPWPQKINDGTVVEIPLGSTAPVISNDNPIIFKTATGANFTNGLATWQTATGFNASVPGSATTGSAIRFDSTATGLVTDLSSATAATINQLRQAFQLQKLYERDARGGTRYTEILKSHFGVISPDARLQRPEYLGGGMSFLNVNPVAQTSPTSGSNAQADLAAFATFSAHSHGFTKSFVEHGYIFGLLCARADINYQQGLNRMWSREIRWDFYWPALSHIGEQAVLNKEIFAQGTAADNNTFGYQERYAEYRYSPSLITGLFRSDATGTLDAWHLAQDFASLPVLNSTFIVENPPTSRVKAVNTEPDFILDCAITSKWARPMPLFGVPGLIDHF